MKKLGTSFVILAFLISAFGWTAAEAAGATTTCTSGAIAPGTYTNLLIKGDCSIPTGTVTVTKNVEIAPNASLNAGIGGATLTVGGNIEVEKNAILVLGCNIADLPCGTTTTDHVSGSITATQALSVILHQDTIGGNVTITGGGGGLNCNVNPRVSTLLGGPIPAIDVLAESTVAGDVTVTKVNSCWEGIKFNQVTGNVIIRGNDFADGDADELQLNTIGKNLLCAGNAPAPDNDGAPNTMTGHELGQCVGL